MAHCDVVIKLDAVTQDYDFGGVKLSPLKEFLRQLQVMMARYRVGDGAGNATVTPATSCVQDSSQALYAAILAIKQQVVSTPEIQKWLDSHPNDVQTLRFEQLVSLGTALEENLTPLGIVRADWKSNAGLLAGTGIGEKSAPFSDRSIWAGLTTWRTMMPRLAHDELATIFLKNGAKLLFLRSNQVGGWQPDILPLAPTALSGQIMVPLTDVSPIATILNRILASLVVPQAKDWLIAIITLLIYAAIAIPLGFWLKFLSPSKPSSFLLIALRCLITPALVEELFFRVLLLPHPTEVINWGRWVIWAILSLLLFIVYHPVNAKTFFRQGFPTFFHPVFLGLAALLGVACTLVYALTSSLWTIVFVHWVVVVVWLAFLGGSLRLEPQEGVRE